MADGRHLENRKTAIFPHRFDQSAQNYFGPPKGMGSENFQLLKIQDGGRRHLEKIKNGHISATP